MSSSEQSIELFIHCGEAQFTSSKLHTQSTIDQIHQEVRSLCGGLLTGPFCLMFYHPQRRKLVKLNENYLSDEYHLFRMRSTPNGIGFHFVELYVSDISDEDGCEPVSQQGTTCYGEPSI